MLFFFGEVYLSNHSCRVAVWVVSSSLVYGSCFGWLMMFFTSFLVLFSSSIWSFPSEKSSLCTCESRISWICSCSTSLFSSCSLSTDRLTLLCLLWDSSWGLLIGSCSFCKNVLWLLNFGIDWHKTMLDDFVLFDLFLCRGDSTTLLSCYLNWFSSSSVIFLLWLNSLLFLIIS